MKYFQNVKTLDELKKEYRKLAMIHHPDCGGSEAAMKELNDEYDRMFPVMKSRLHIVSKETADSDRYEFYTQNGWKGKNYKCGRSTKEIAQIVRSYLKEIHSDCRFSVSIDSASMCSSLYVYLMEAPWQAFKNPTTSRHEINQYWFSREDSLTPECYAVMKDVLDLINSYRMDDSDGMIDYFDTNFYLTLGVGKWDKPFKVVPRQKKANADPASEYETFVVKKTRTKKVVKPVQIPTPETITEGMMFRPLGYFTGQIHKGGVYKITNLFGTQNDRIWAHWMGRQNKKPCTGNTPGNLFSTSIQDLLKWTEKKSIEFVELKEIEETEEYETTVARKVSKNKVVPV